MHEKVKRVLQMFEGGDVRRCHTLPHHGHYDVAHHTFGMLVLYDVLRYADPPEKRAVIMTHILRHDMLERWLGDTPCVAKQLLPDLRSNMKRAEAVIAVETGVCPSALEEEDRRFVKALDWLEFLIWCDKQIGMGYAALIPKRVTVIEGLLEMNPEKSVRDFLEHYEWYRTPDNPTAQELSTPCS